MNNNQHYLPPAPIGSPTGSVAWVEWFRKVREVAESGQTAYIQLETVTTPALADKLNKNTADVLGATITFNTVGAFKVGDVTWNGVTATGTGVLFTDKGIVGASNGTPKFVLSNNGSATFAGELSAATGTFAGALSAASGTFSGDIAAGGSIYCTGLTNQFISIQQTGVGTNNIDPSILSTVSTNTGAYTGTGIVGRALNPSGTGVCGISSPISKFGVYGLNQNTANTAAGVVGFSEGEGVGVVGESINGKALYGYAHNASGYSFFGDGRAHINGTLNVTGLITGTVSNAKLVNNAQVIGGTGTGGTMLSTGLSSIFGFSATAMDGYVAGVVSISGGNVLIKTRDKDGTEAAVVYRFVATGV